jgi:hypothetical protein
MPGQPCLGYVSGHFAGVPPGEVSVPGGGELHGDLGSRVTGPDHQHIAFGELLGAAVVARMELGDRGSQPLPEGRDAGRVVRTRGYDHVFGEVSLLTGAHLVTAAIASQRIHVPAEAHRQAELPGVILQVVGCLVFGG